MDFILSGSELYTSMKKQKFDVLILFIYLISNITLSMKK